MKEDTIHGFRIGADDYVTKPFDREELLLRIEAILLALNAAAATLIGPASIALCHKSGCPGGVRCRQ